MMTRLQDCKTTIWFILLSFFLDTKKQITSWVLRTNPSETYFTWMGLHLPHKSLRSKQRDSPAKILHQCSESLAKLEPQHREIFESKEARTLYNIQYLMVKIDGANIPKGRLVKGPYKPICRDCAIYFSTTVSMPYKHWSWHKGHDCLIEITEHCLRFSETTWGMYDMY